MSKTDGDVAVASRHPALAWAASGAMHLTGPADGAPVVAGGTLAAAADRALRRFVTLAAAVAPPVDLGHSVGDIGGAALLGERAALLGLARRGTVSPGGSCRLLPTRDGWIAVNLARPDDVASIPAWLGCSPGADPWGAVADTVVVRRAAPVVARARLLGLAAAVAAETPRVPPPWLRELATPAHPTPPSRRRPLVVDLSALWAGPLATSLLARAGARVVKVESTRRPDGARRGSAAFFDLMHAGKESVALDFHDARDRGALVRLLRRADVVVESARPRALAQLGIDAAALVADHPGLTWVSITGYGRSGRAADWIAFGDDAGVAAGLATATGRAANADTPLFCGDAIADPLTGLHAAVAALAGWASGGGLFALALRDVAAHAAASGPTPSPATMHPVRDSAGHAGWEVRADGDRQRVLPPRARAPHGTAHPLGADTDAVLREVDRG